MKVVYKDVGLSVLCGLIGKSRQAFYDKKNRKEQQLIDASIIVELVERERQIAKRIGGKKLHRILKQELLEHGIDIGVQKFMDILRANNLLVSRKSRKPKLTDSQHKLPTYPNKARNLHIDKSELLWVSDITYIKVFDQFCYLFLITDAYSRKVVGYNFSRRMTAKCCIKALNLALENRRYPDRKLMHHSDRGSQYCARDYVAILNCSDIVISMTENGDPLENPLAERMNRTFKDTFGLDENFPTFEKASHRSDESIKYYNERLPHSSIDMLTPDQAHQHEGRLKKHWTYYWLKMQDPKPEDNFYTPR